LFTKGNLLSDNAAEERDINMLKNESKLFKIAAILFVVLVILIYFGSYLKYLLSYSWFGTAAVIAILFIWITIFFIATIITAKGTSLIKERLRGKERLDFVAKLGVLVAEYRKTNDKMEVGEFFEILCKDNGVMDIPDLNKYIDENFSLKGTRETVFETLRKEIEEAAIAWSKEKK
jgi:hypothetical protein